MNRLRRLRDLGAENVLRLLHFALREPGLILSLAVLTAGAWAFAELADEVVEGETHGVDERVLLALREAGDPSDPLGPPWLEEAVGDLTALGGVPVLVLVALVACGYLWLEGKRRMALFVALAAAGGGALSFLLKAGFARPRPELVSHGMTSFSFPSGHSMMSAVAYLTLAALLVRVQTRWRMKVYLVAVALVLTLLVGGTRVYLGVHWPTDVLAGWIAGVFWALLARETARLLQRRGVLEPPADRSAARGPSDRPLEELRGPPRGLGVD